MFGLVPFERNELWNPFREFENEFFKGFGNVTHCRTDIKDEGDKFVLECEMPGFNKEDIKIDINGSTLTLCATHKADNSEKTSSGEYIRRERSYGSYCRSFDISGIDENAIGAAYTNGILTLTLPKKRSSSRNQSELRLSDFHDKGNTEQRTVRQLCISDCQHSLMLVGHLLKICCRFFGRLYNDDAVILYVSQGRIVQDDGKDTVKMTY